MHGVSHNLKPPTKRVKKAYSRDPPACSPNHVLAQRAKTYMLEPLNQYASNYKKFIRFGLTGVGEIIPESTSYCSACDLDLMIIRMVANRRTGQSKNLYINFKKQKRGPDVEYKRLYLCAELRDSLFCQFAYLIEDDHQHERLWNNNLCI